MSTSSEPSRYLPQTLPLRSSRFLVEACEESRALLGRLFSGRDPCLYLCEQQRTAENRILRHRCVYRPSNPLARIFRGSRSGPQPPIRTEQPPDTRIFYGLQLILCALQSMFEGIATGLELPVVGHERPVAFLVL